MAFFGESWGAVAFWEDNGEGITETVFFEYIWEIEVLYLFRDNETIQIIW